MTTRYLATYAIAIALTGCKDPAPIEVVDRYGLSPRTVTNITLFSNSGAGGRGAERSLYPNGIGMFFRSLKTAKKAQVVAIEPHYRFVLETDLKGSVARGEIHLDSAGEAYLIVDGSRPFLFHCPELFQLATNSLP